MIVLWLLILSQPFRFAERGWWPRNDNFFPLGLCRPIWGPGEHEGSLDIELELEELELLELVEELEPLDVVLSHEPKYSHTHGTSQQP